MKKSLISTLILAGLMPLSMLSGCAKTDNHGLDAENPVTITIWHYYNGVQQTCFDKMVNEFNETIGAENGIIVEAYTKSSINELANSVLASFNGDADAEPVPDIFASYAETAFIVDEMDKCVDLNQYFTEEEKAKYIDGYIQEGQFDNEGELVIFPIAKSTEIMMINKTDWEAFAQAEGVSEDELKTWEGVVRVAEKYYTYTDAMTPDIKNDGKAFFGRDSVANYMIVGAKQLGMEIYSVNGTSATVNVDKTVLKKLWENYYVPFVKGHYALKGRYSSDDIKTGNIIASVCSTTGAAYFPDSVTINDDYTYPIEILTVPVPGFENTENCIVQQGAGMVVSKSDETQEYASVMFLKWFTESQRNIEFAVSSGYLPVTKEASNMEMINKTISEQSITIKDVLKESTKVAVESINNSQLYAAKPFNKAAEARDFVGEFIEESAKKAYEEAWARINSGEEYKKVVEEYTNDSAFEKWYTGFNEGITGIIS